MKPTPFFNLVVTFLREHSKKLEQGEKIDHYGTIGYWEGSYLTWDDVIDVTEVEVYPDKHFYIVWKDEDSREHYARGRWLE